MVACSSDGDDDADTSAASTTSATVDGDGVYPTSIDTKFGEVVIDEAPQRVVALGWGDAETALALGVQPVGASDWLGFEGDGVGPWVTQSYSESPEILGTTELDYEAIAALNPDLILDVRSSGDQDRYDTLSAIAPTVGVPVDGDNYLTTREQQVKMIAAALGKTEEGEQELASVDDRIAEIRDAHPEWSDQTISVLAKSAEEWAAYTAGDARADLLLDLGFQENPWVAEQAASEDSFYLGLSPENLGEANSDVVVALPISGDAAELENDPAWQALPAVIDGKAIVVDGDLAQAFSLGTVEATLWALDTLETQLAEITA
ncbi:MAG: iron-siderophore ABC transporter substrate-binding protein [Corynebacterium sp.]|nr:iron-siderophore ABC transporter substrate-binding protein [Corynebacterium sp.]